MVRGEAVFKCPKCGQKFVALDIEWRATVKSAPVKCPHCGNETSKRTRSPVCLFKLFE